MLPARARYPEHESLLVLIDHEVIQDTRYSPAYRRQHKPIHACLPQCALQVQFHPHE